MCEALATQYVEAYGFQTMTVRPFNHVGPGQPTGFVCSDFARQIAAIKPKVMVALGAVAAKNLLAINAPMSELRGRWYDFRPAGARSNDSSWSGARLAVTYHPAFLLRDPRQKGEAWKDLQMVMRELGMPVPTKAAE